jgi:hypothetical protein
LIFFREFELFILDELQTLINATMDAADQFTDDTSEWLLVEHRLQSIKEKFDFLFARTNREHRELKVNLFFSTFLTFYFPLVKSRSNRRYKTCND